MNHDPLQPDWYYYGPLCHSCRRFMPEVIGDADDAHRPPVVVTGTPSQIKCLFCGNSSWYFTREYVRRKTDSHGRIA